MISPDLARHLAAAGLLWSPRSGDVFTIPGATPSQATSAPSAVAGAAPANADAAPGPEAGAEVGSEVGAEVGAEVEHYVVSELTIEPRTYPTGTILAFNGTTEWALDSVAAEDALWLPREEQLRTLLGAQFRALRVEGGPAGGDRERYCVETQSLGLHYGPCAADAYGEALLALLRAAVD